MNIENTILLVKSINEDSKKLKAALERLIKNVEAKAAQRAATRTLHVTTKLGIVVSRIPPTAGTNSIPAQMVA